MATALGEANLNDPVTRHLRRDFTQLHGDPQVAADPIALAAADMITLLLYFNLARWLLS